MVCVCMQKLPNCFRKLEEVHDQNANTVNIKMSQGWGLSIPYTIMFPTLSQPSVEFQGKHCWYRNSPWDSLESFATFKGV